MKCLRFNHALHARSATHSDLDRTLRRTQPRLSVTKGVFIYRSGSGYADDPTSQYQFPTRRYLSRAASLVDDWIVYLEPRRGGSRGYFAAAKVAAITPDPTDAEMHLAVIEPGSFIEFDAHLPFSDGDGPVERGLLNPTGGASGNKQAAVRPISSDDFNRIIDRGLPSNIDLLPRQDVDEPLGPIHHFEEERVPYQFEIVRDRTATLTSRPIRDRSFRKNILEAYQSRCCFSGLKLINGGGRAEVEAAHIRPVEYGGPDAVANGLALSGTAHWMFDRGLLSLEDDYSLKISRHVNDTAGLLAFLRPDQIAAVSPHSYQRPHPRFLAWHRDNVFKR